MGILKKLIIPIIIAVLIIYSLFSFISKLDRYILQSHCQVLQENAGRYALTINIKLKGLYYALECLAKEISPGFVDIDASLVNEYLSSFDSSITAVSDFGDFEYIGFADMDGNAVADEGSTAFVGNTEYYIDGIAGKNAIVNESKSPFNGRTNFVLSVPIFFDGQVCGVLFGCLDNQAFGDLLVVETTGGEEAVYLCDSYARMLAVARSKPVMISRDTMLNHNLPITYGNTGGSEAILADLLAGKSNTVDLTVDGRPYFFSYERLGINDWYVMSLVNQAVVYENNSFITKNMAWFSFDLVLIAVLLILYIWYNIRQKTKLLEREKELLRKSEERYRALDDMTDNIMFEIELSNGEITFNHNYSRIFGTEPYLTNINQWMEVQAYIAEEDWDTYWQYCQSIINGEREFATDFRIICADGLVLWHHVEYTTLYNIDDKPFMIVGKLININEQKNELVRLQYQAQTDSLTKLYNHESVIRHIDAFLSGEGAGGRHALLLADIDDFKQINDTFGHHCGDDTLRRYVAFLCRLFRSTDIIGRLGGDEFVILLKNTNSDNIVIKKALALCESQPLSIVDKDIIHNITSSVGIAVFPQDGDCFKDLYRKADMALYRAKAQGKKRYCFFDEEED